ncbi:hypothetical protein ACWEOV_37360 [Streptomyces sp. NPDC004365]
MVVEEGWRMGSPFEELEAREAAARLRVEELEAEVAELSGKLELARAGLERLRITRETVTEVLAEMTPEKPAVAIDAALSIVGGPVVSAYAGAEPASHRGADGAELAAGNARATCTVRRRCLSPWP